MHAPDPPLQLEITSLAVGGEGVARLDGKVYFVPHTLPADIVTVQIVEDKPRFARARALTRIQDSPHRRDTPCAFAERCGGCPWMALVDDQQDLARASLVTELMVRVGKLPRDVVQATRPSPLKLGYRNRLRLHVEGQNIGMRIAEGREIVDIPHCAVSLPALNQLLEWARQWLKPVLPLRHLMQLELQVEASGALLLAVSGQDVTRLPPFPAGFPEVMVKRDNRPLQVFGGPRLPFAQANPIQNQALVTAALEALEPDATSRVLDLYAGAGNFSLPLVGKVAEVLGIEFSLEAVQQAQKSVEQLPRSRTSTAEYWAGDCETAVQQLVKQKTRWDRVLLDPPRAGALEVCRLLRKLQAQRIVYVSCDPATLARDLKVLVEGGYRVLKVVPFDMMPQTARVECLAVLERQRD